MRVHHNFITAARALKGWFETVRRRGDMPRDYYCGITNDIDRRLDEHNVGERDLFCWVATDCFDTARWTERMMDAATFDCGDQLGNGQDDTIYVYLYRKAPHTIEK